MTKFFLDSRMMHGTFGNGHKIASLICYRKFINAFRCSTRWMPSNKKSVISYFQLIHHSKFSTSITNY